jgi:alpha-D-xyloside xylohydrolase
MSLFPYRYRAAQESARNGMPIIRSLVLVHQQDREARQAIYEYYFGPDFLVAPVVTSATEQHVYLPEGDWIDFWTGERLKGPRNLVVDAPLEKIPVYVKSGAIIPKIPEEVMTLVPAAQLADRSVKTLDDRRIFEIYPGGSAEIEDFEGRSIAVRQGAAPNAINISGKPARITILWRYQSPKEVLVEGKAMPLSSSEHGVSVTFAHTERSRLSWR